MLAQVISRAVDDRTFTVQPEEADDLLAIRRVLEAGDLVSGVTSRVVKREREHARPDRGERVTMRLTVQVESAALDSVLDRLRVRGTITASTHESVQRGSHHSIIVQPGETVSVAKARWAAVHRRLVSGGGGGGGGAGGGPSGFILVAVDSAECGVARLKGTRLSAASPIRSGAGGKRYGAAAAGGAGPAKYLDGIASAVGSLAQRGDAVVVFGPGEAKRRVANLLQRGGGAAWGGGSAPPVTVVEGGDTGGMDGIYAFTRSAAMRKVIGGGKLAAVYGIVEEVMRRAGARSRRFAMGYAESDRASRVGAVESLVFSERLLHDAGEQAAVDLLNRVDDGGGAVYGADSSTDAGMQVAGLGGVACILRYAVD